MQRLLTRWTLRPYHYKPGPTSSLHPETSHETPQKNADLPSQDRTEVNLSIDFQFANPVYAALSQAAAPKIAEKMIEAFEKRVKAVVDGPASVKGVGSAFEGVLKAK